MTSLREPCSGSRTERFQVPLDTFRSQRSSPSREYGGSFLRRPNIPNSVKGKVIIGIVTKHSKVSVRFGLDGRSNHWHLHFEFQAPFHGSRQFKAIVGTGPTIRLKRERHKVMVKDTCESRAPRGCGKDIC